jgi:hypothetical protein
MRAVNVLILFALLPCESAFADEAETNGTPVVPAAEETATRLWISSFQPITVTTDHRQDIPRPSTPEVPKPLVLEWRTNYAVLSEQLLVAAEKARLDIQSLKKILSYRSTEYDWALLPVEATSTRFKDEPVWVVEFRWEYRDLVGGGYLVHFSRETYSRRTLKLLSDEHCG